VVPRASLESGKSQPTGIRSTDRPARSSVAIPTELPGPHYPVISYIILHVYRSIPCYRGADKSLARSASISIDFSVQGTGGSSTGPDPENRVGDQDIGYPGRPVSCGLQVPGEPFPSWPG
jgi:hypothetical protein